MKAIKIWIASTFYLLFVLFFCQQIVFSGESELTPGKKRRIESDAIYTYETIISLCKTERFDEIYEYGDKYSRERMSKEMFVSEHKGCGLAPSWETSRSKSPIWRFRTKAGWEMSLPFFMHVSVSNSWFLDLLTAKTCRYYDRLLAPFILSPVENHRKEANNYEGRSSK